MKVVQINALYGEKSTGVIVKDLDFAIQKNDMDSYVVYREAEKQPSNGIIVGNKRDWYIHALRTRVDGKQGHGSFVSTQRLIKVLKKINPDIIHLHNIHSNFVNFPGLIQYVKTNHVTLVLTLHDCWFFTGKCYHFADIGCEKWKTGCGKCPKRQMDIPSLLIDSSAAVFKERLQLFDYDQLYVVGCSKWITSMAQQSPVFRKANIRCIYNGIDIDTFSPRINEREDSNQFLIVTMANKWFEDANKDTRAAVLDFLGDSGKLMIIGCNEEQVKMYTNDSRILCKGYIRDRAQLAKLYAQGSVFLNLTHIDNLPTVNMEALACGLPVVTFDAGGSGELVEHGKTGFIVAIDNSKGIVEALQQVQAGYISHEECRRYALNQFDKQKNYNRYIQLYLEIAKLRRK